MNSKDNFGQFIILIAIVVISLLFVMNNSLNLKKNPKYTVGVVKKFMDGRTGRSIVFEYHVNNKMYSELNNISFMDQSLIGKKYIVKFYKKNPSISNILLNYPVPDTLKTIPISGWEELPVLK